MKRIFTFLLIVFACIITASAERITEQQALQKAQQFMKGKQFANPEKSRGRDNGAQKQQGYYVFNAEDGGFVIVAGDDRMPEILGYSEHGKIEMEAAPCGLKWLLGCYEQMAKSESPLPARNKTRAVKPAIAPFVTTTWGQSTPYNAMCPRVNGARCVTGCVATAMAQIMNYYCWPNEVTKPIPGYTTFTNKVSMSELEPTTFTWGHLNKANLSKLMLYCGQAVEMNYGPKESSAGDPANALKEYFGYEENLRIVSKSDYADDTWNDILYEELAAQRPIYYCGNDEVSGHAFILCGYANDHFYVNWGWDGGADGYYVLDGFSPAVGAYNNYQMAVIGIKPKGEPAPVTFFPRRIVMENFAWIGNSQNVLGIESIKRLTSEYPDNFIGIDLHASDQMEGAENYGYMSNRLLCFPNSYINRITNLSPYYTDIKPIVEAQKNAATAIVDATATYAKPDRSAIKVNAESIFGFNSSNEDFRLAFVLLEDNVGPYTQDNSMYSNPSKPDNPNDWMNDWVHKGQQVEMTFDCVARGIYGDARGIEGSLPSTIESGKSYNYEYTFNVPKPKWDWITYNQNNFRVVALLIDKSTGEIMNACQTNITYDKSIENLEFEFINEGKRLTSGEIAEWKSKGIAEDNLTIGTNLTPNGLKLCSFNRNKISGTANLEILTNTLGSSSITWEMGGENLEVNENSKTITFSSNANGVIDVLLKANDIQQFGILEAKLTATVNDVSQSVIIKFVHRQTEAFLGDDIELSDGQAWWNNSDEGSYMQGTHQEERYYAATFIPANLFGEKVPTIDGVGFYGSTSGMANIKVWLSSHLPASGEEPDIANICFPDDELKIDEWNKMVFHQQYPIPGDGIYIGYSFDIVDMNTFRSSTPVIFSEKTRENALWFKTESMSEWIDRFDDLQGNLDLRILFGGNAIKKNAVSISTIPPVYALTNSTVRIPITIRNDGCEMASGIIADGDFGRIRIPVAMSPYCTFNYLLPVNVGTKAEFRHGTIQIAEVNGVPNESNDNSANVDLYVSRQKSPTNVVLEEFTATWCGYSTQANMVMDEFRKEFGDSLITICVHGCSMNANDPMYIPEYDDVRTLSGGAYPSLVINRQGNAINNAWTPFFECDLGEFVKEAYDVKIPGSIEVGAEWNDESHEAINIQTRTTFELNATELPFQIAYVLIEDGMSGEGDEWAQNNVYSGIEEIYDRRLEELTKLPPLIYGQKYYNVPVAAWDAYKGVPGSLTGPFTAGVPVEGSFLADIKDNKLIQNKENLSVVALIVNKDTGKIINAAKCKIGETLTPSYIDVITTERKTSDIYDIRGQKVGSQGTSTENLPKGVYIINGKKIVKL